MFAQADAGNILEAKAIIGGNYGGGETVNAAASQLGTKSSAYTSIVVDTEGKDSEDKKKED